MGECCVRTWPLAPNANSSLDNLRNLGYSPSHGRCSRNTGPTLLFRTLRMAIAFGPTLWGIRCPYGSIQTLIMVVISGSGVSTIVLDTKQHYKLMGSSQN